MAAKMRSFIREDFSKKYFPKKSKKIKKVRKNWYFSKKKNFVQNLFIIYSSRMKDLIFAAIFKSTSRIFFYLENPEISAVLDLKLVGGRGSVFCSAAVENTKKIFFFFFERVFIRKQTTSKHPLASFRRSLHNEITYPPCQNKKKLKKFHEFSKKKILLPRVFVMN